MPQKAPKPMPVLDPDLVTLSSGARMEVMFVLELPVSIIYVAPVDKYLYFQELRSACWELWAHLYKYYVFRRCV